MAVRLLANSSIPEPAMRRCVHGKDTLGLFPIGAKHFTRCDDPVKRKTCKQNPKRGVLRRWVRETQNAWFMQ